MEAVVIGLEAIFWASAQNQDGIRWASASDSEGGQGDQEKAVAKVRRTLGPWVSICTFVKEGVGTVRF